MAGSFDLGWPAGDWPARARYGQLTSSADSEAPEEKVFHSSVARPVETLRPALVTGLTANVVTAPKLLPPSELVTAFTVSLSTLFTTPKSAIQPTTKVPATSAPANSPMTSLPVSVIGAP